MNLISKKLLQIMQAKKTNLALSADVKTFKDLLQLAQKMGPHICILKTHADILEDFDIKQAQKLRELADQFSFLILEDRKFADIGNTVKQQFAGGIYKIAQWADLITAHAIAGQGTLEGLIAGMQKNRDCGLVLLAQMSSKDNLISTDYTQQVIELAKKFHENTIGFISQKRLTNEPPFSVRMKSSHFFFHLTPGIKFSEGDDPLGQQYTTPQTALQQNQTDIIIVGRGILDVANPELTAKKYQEIGWELYQQQKLSMT